MSVDDNKNYENGIPRAAKTYTFSTNSIKLSWIAINSCLNEDYISNNSLKNTNFGRNTDIPFSDQTYFRNLQEIIDAFGDNYPNDYYDVNVIIEIKGNMKCCATLGYCDGDTVSNRFLKYRYRSNDFGAASSYFQLFDREKFEENEYVRYQGPTPQFNGKLSREIDWEWILNYDCVAKDCGESSFDIKFTYEITVDLLQPCKESRFYAKSFCQDWCADNENACLTATRDYCFNSDAFVLQSRYLTGDDTCRRNLENAYSKNLTFTSTILDASIKNICVNLYNQNIVTPELINSGKSNLINNQTLITNLQKACACRLPDSVYLNFRNELIKKYPTFSNLQVGNFSCLFPNCATSPIRPIQIRGLNRCPITNCLNLINVQNSGVFQNVTINQTGSCLYLNPNQTSSPSSSPQPSSLPPIPTIIPPTIPPTKTPTQEGLNLGLILGVSIPLGIILVFFFIFIIIRIKRKK
jgi:hypothetical protein